MPLPSIFLQSGVATPSSFTPLHVYWHIYSVGTNYTQCYQLAFRDRLNFQSRQPVRKWTDLNKVNPHMGISRLRDWKSKTPRSEGSPSPNAKPPFENWYPTKSILPTEYTLSIPGYRVSSLESGGAIWGLDYQFNRRTPGTFCAGLISFWDHQNANGHVSCIMRWDYFADADVIGTNACCA